MSTSPHYVRRAHIEDLPQMQALWKLENLPAGELERQFTQFQVVEGPGGEVLALIGLEVAGDQGRMHGEAIAHFDQADAMRELLWERVQMVARNHGLNALWTQFEAPFWRTKGFEPATPAGTSALPAAWTTFSGAWSRLPLKSQEAQETISRELALMRTYRQQEAEAWQRRTRTLKLIAAIVLVVVFLCMAVWAFFLLKFGPRFLHRG